MGGSESCYLTVMVGVEIIQEHAVATMFEARTFKAVSSGHGFCDVVDDVTARSSSLLTLAAAWVIVVVVDAITVSVCTIVG